MNARRSFSVFFAVAVFLPCHVMAQSAQQDGQVYQQPSLQDGGKRAASTDSTQTQRPMTTQDQAQMQRIQQQQDQRGNPMAAEAPNMNYPPKLPPGFPLPAEQEKYMHELLDYWEKSGEQVKRSTCDFIRREYDPLHCNYRDPQNKHLVPFTISLGKIHFSSPDKGRYETDEIWDFSAPPAKPGEEPDYNQRDISENRERWICDGRAIYQYDYANKRLNESKIPPELQGNALVHSPLPFFLFGADKKMILERYWIRPVTPPGVENAYWLEAFPKRVEDARIYKKLEIIIARDDFLPESLVMYASNYEALKNPTSRSFEFTNRKVNSHLDAIRDFFTLFERPPTPIGWKRVEIKPPPPPQQAAVPKEQK